MDNQDTARNLLIAGGLFFAILIVGPKLLPPLPTPRPTSPTGDGRVAPGAGSPAADGGTSSAVSPKVQAGTDQPVQEKVTATVFDVVEADSVQTPVMGSAPIHGRNKSAISPYRMRLTLSSIGASVESATITDHAEAVGSDARYRLLSPIELEDGALARSLAIEQIDIDDVTVRLSDKTWHTGPVTETADGASVAFWIEIQHDGAPVLKLTHSFTLPKQPREKGRHDLASTLTVENLSASPHQVVVTSRGGIGVRRNPGARMDDRFIDWGTIDAEPGATVVGQRKTRRNVVKLLPSPLKLFAPSPTSPHNRFSWAATANTYFTCTIAPLTPSGKDNPDYLAAVSAVDLDGSAATEGDTAVRFVTKRRRLAPGAAVTYPSDLYLGEKDGDAFRDVPIYRDRNYYFQISQGFGMCTFSFLVELMIRLLNGLHWIVRDYGLAIIILVLCVRALLHPITKKGQINMVRMQHRMQQMAPKIEEIKKKYANDKARMNQEMMKLNMNPAGQLLTCLPMVIQMPIWVALYISLSSNIGMRHVAPFWGMTWMHDLTAPDALYVFASPIVVPVLGWHITAFNLLPILVAVFMYSQQKLQPKPAPSPDMSEKQKQQQDMMKMMMPMMSVMMLFIFYKMPSGLNLYIMSSSLFGTVEQHRIRKHIKEREAAGTLHQPDPPKKNRKDKKDKGPHKPGKPTILERMQAMADEAQKAQRQARRPNKRKVRR